MCVCIYIYIGTRSAPPLGVVWYISACAYVSAGEERERERERKWATIKTERTPQLLYIYIYLYRNCVGVIVLYILLAYWLNHIIYNFIMFIVIRCTYRVLHALNKMLCRSRSSWCVFFLFLSCRANFAVIVLFVCFTIWLQFLTAYLLPTAKLIYYIKCAMFFIDSK